MKAVRGYDWLDTDRPAWWRRGLAQGYGAGVRMRVHLWRSGRQKPWALPKPVISVGNLTVGGAGKTPMTAYLARGLVRRGRKPAVISRGYRRESRDPVTVVSDGLRVLAEPDRVGDEPYLLAETLVGVPVLVGPDRHRVGRAAIDRFDPDVLILDDGYQHLALARDLNLLLLDAERPWANGRLLPAGPLREPKSAAGRADAFILTRSSVARPEAAAGLAEDFPDRPIFAAHHRPTEVAQVDGADLRPADYLAGRRVGAFCGLCRPQALARTLEDLGAEVMFLVGWPDHFRPGPSDLRHIENLAAREEVDEVVTTAKDAVKLDQTPWGHDLKKWILKVEMTLWDREDEFWRLIEETVLK
jgi:tetraacyldisaccharide 4'-kinase